MKQVRRSPNEQRRPGGEYQRVSRRDHPIGDQRVLHLLDHLVGVLRGVDRLWGYAGMEAQAAPDRL
jgi:hypothetical protein